MQSTAPTAVDLVETENDQRKPSYEPMVVVFAAMVFGICCDRLINPNWLIYPFLIVGCALCWLWCRALKQERYAMSIRALALLLVVSSASAFWSHARWNWFGAENIGAFASEDAIPIGVAGVIRSEPRFMASTEQSVFNPIPSTDRTRMEFDATDIRNGRTWQKTTGRIDLVVHGRVDDLRSGDHVQVYGRLKKISGPTNPGQFDFESHYRGQGKIASLHAYSESAVSVTAPANLYSLKRLQSYFRRELNRITWEYVSPERAPLAAAILLGNREQLTSKRRDLFLLTGTVHILAISGLHIGILAGSIFLFYRLGIINRVWALWLTIVFVVFYAWLVEFRSPVSRAAILIVLYCAGRLRGYTTFSLNWLATAGVIVLSINPNEVFQIGTQLSFMAVGIITIGRDWVFWPPSNDPIKKLIRSTRPFHVRVLHYMGRGLRTAFLVSGLIWLIAVPLVAARFHLVAPVALVANPLLLIPIAIGLYAGLGVLVFGWFLPPVASFCGWICDWSLGLIEVMISSAGRIPGGHFWTSGPMLWAVYVFYFGVLVLMMYPPTKVRGRWLIICGLIWVAACWVLPGQFVSRNDSGKLACTFVDVGHGTGVLIQTPDGKTVLYDAGSFGSAAYGFRNVAGVLWHHQLNHIDAVIISHADVDHFNAIPELCTRFSIGCVYVSPQMKVDDAPAVVELFKALEKYRIQINVVSEGDQITVSDDVVFEIISPAKEMDPSYSDNANSLVLLGKFQGRSILLPGDLEGSGMTRLLTQDPIDVDVAMTPHHGSKNSSPKEFFSWCTPELAIFSASGTRVDHSVIRQAEELGIMTYATSERGAIRVEIGDRVTVRGFLDD